MNERQVLINFIASLSLADHMGDAASDAEKALKMIGIEMPADYNGSQHDGWWYQIAHYLSRNYGAKTVWGTSLQEDEEPGA